MSGPTPASTLYPGALLYPGAEPFTPPPPPPPPPVPRPEPALGSVGEELYARLAPLAEVDDETGWSLKYLCGALGNTIQGVNDLARDTDTHVGWGSILDVDAAPAYTLPWLAQMVGVTLPGNLTTQQIRDRIRDETGFERGTRQALIAAAQTTLTGGKSVFFEERDSSAYHLTVTTHTAETPNSTATLNALLAVKPAGLVLVLVTVAGQTYSELRAGYATYQDVKNHYATYLAVRDNL